MLSGKLDFKGTVSDVSANAEVKGHLAVSTGALTDFIAAVVRASGQAPPRFDSSVVGNFTFDGDIEYTPTRLAVTDFKMSMGGETATGTLALEEGKTPSFTGHVALAKIDLEKWLALLAVPGAFQPSTPTPVPAATAAPRPPAPAAQAAKPAPAAQAAKPARGAGRQTCPAAPAAKPAAPAKSNSLSPFPTEMDVSLSLTIAEVLYRKGTMRDLAVALEIHKGVITVPQLKAVLPGDMVLQANAAAPAAPAAQPAKPASPPPAPAAGAVQATGDFSLAGPKLRDTLAWLGIDTSGVPADKLQKLDLKGKLASTAGGLQIAGLTADLDGQLATGSGGVAFSMPLTATATLQIDRFDLDAYMPPEPPRADRADHRRRESGDRHAGTARRPRSFRRAAAARQDLPVFGLKAKVAKLVFRKETLSGVEGDVSVQGNLLKLNAVKVADLLGAKMDVQGSVTDFGTAPRYDLTFNATMPDADKVIAYAGLPNSPTARSVRRRPSGSMVGTLNALALRNVSATLLGSTMRATGAMALGQQFPLRLPDLRSADPGRKPAARGGDGPPGRQHRRHRVAGAFKGDASARPSTAPHGVRHGDDRPSRCHPGQRPNITANLRVPARSISTMAGRCRQPPPAPPGRRPLQRRRQYRCP